MGDGGEEKCGAGRRRSSTSHSCRGPASSEPGLEGCDTLFHIAAIPCFSLGSREGVRPLGSRDTERERMLPAPPRPEDSKPL